MSETDDTDVLVLVPPDFFAVETSDSDESLTSPFYNGRCFTSENHQGTHNEDVNTLIHHVNRLENRLSLIESKDSIETNISDHRDLNSTNANHFDSPKKSFSGIFQTTPQKFRQLTSLPSTPSSTHVDYHRRSHSLPRRKPTSHPSYDSAIDSERSFRPRTQSNMSYQEQRDQKPSQNYLKSNNITPGKEPGFNQLAGGDVRTVTQPRYNAELMDEIDQFLDNVAKTPQAKRSAYERSKQDSLYKCGENSASVPDLNYGLRDFNSLPVREEPVNIKHISQLESQPQNGEPKRLNLPEVEKLLKEMETTQNIIEYKLRQKEAQFGKGARDAASFQRRSLQSGDSIGSVPDLGFGIRDLMVDPPSDEKRTPVHEDKVIKRSMSLCGVNPSDQAVSKPANQKPNADGNAHKTFAPRRLELGNDPGSIPDLGFGLIDWYRNNPSSDSQTNSTNPRSVHESKLSAAGNYAEGDNASSIPDLGFGLRDLWSINSTSKSTSNQGDLNSQGLGKASLHSESHPSSQSTATGSASTVVEAPCTKRVDFSTESGFEDARSSELEHASVSKPSSYLTLSKLWGDPAAREPSEVHQRLQEERCRREHCERLIQQLQSRLLEEQQKLAVALALDTAKDGAIRHVHGAWAQLASHWTALEGQRHELANQLQDERGRYQATVADTLGKLKRYELELSQSLDIAHSYKEKFEQVERDKNEFTKAEIQKFHAKIQERDQAVLKANQEKSKIQGEREELLRKVSILEDEGKKDRAALLNMKRDLDKKNKTMNAFEADTSALKEEKETLQLMLREEKSRNTLLEQQKKNTQTALEESKRKEKQLQEEVKATAVNAEAVKKELRDFYQEQVEIVVRDKLQEFQGQLDSAEKSLRIELENREQAITAIATKQISQISEKHQLEVKLLEEKHKEELQLYQLKLSQATSHIHKLQNKLKSSANRKGEIVEQLHGVMEAQWQQALRIIQGNSPLLPPTRSSKSQRSVGPDSSAASSGMDLGSLRGPAPVPPLDISQCTSRPSTGETPFGKDGQLTYRPGHANDKPSGQEIENNLKKYIEMLLNRSPGSADLDDSPWQRQSNGQTERPRESQSAAANANVKQIHWEKVDSSIEQGAQISASDYDLSRASQSSSSKETRSGKPPWK